MARGKLTITIDIIDEMTLADAAEEITNAVEEIRNDGQSSLFHLTEDHDHGIYVDHGNGFVHHPEQVGRIVFEVE